MKTQIVVISMWVIIGILLSFNYPILSSIVFGALFAGFLIHFATKVGEYIGGKLWKFIKMLED